MALDKSLNNLAQSSPRVTPSKRSQVRIGLAGGGRRIRTFGSWSRDRQNVMEDGTAVSERERICWGTKGSNPSPSARCLSVTVHHCFHHSRIRRKSSSACLDTSTDIRHHLRNKNGL